MIIAVGTARPAKLSALRASIERVSSLDAAWSDVEIIAREVRTAAPAMPLSDNELMNGARERAVAVRDVLLAENISADLYVGLEGGFHSIEFDARHLTFLRGWAYVTDGSRESFGASPSILVPSEIVRAVVEGGRELAEVIDETAGEQDVRSRQGAWGVLSRDLLTRAMSFEIALVAAFAQFYNSKLYEGI
jgi:inosine/xanthosine triphosphatase